MKHKHLVVGIGLLIVIGLIGVGFALSGQMRGAALGPNVIRQKRAAELPTTDPDTVGIFEQREDNRLLIGTHIVRFDRVRECDDCPARKNISYDGPVVEIVITHDTIIYEDITSFDDPVVDGKVQQRLQPGRLDEIGPQALVQVWGEQQGDRLVARVLVYDYLPD